VVQYYDTLNMRIDILFLILVSVHQVASHVALLLQNQEEGDHTQHQDQTEGTALCRGVRYFLLFLYCIFVLLTDFHVILQHFAFSYVLIRKLIQFCLNLTGIKLKMSVVDMIFYRLIDIMGIKMLHVNRFFCLFSTHVQTSYYGLVDFVIEYNR